jgi:hypothetical protein
MNICSLKLSTHIRKIDLKDILFVEGLHNYVIIQTASERIASLQPLKKLRGNCRQTILHGFINLISLHCGIPSKKDIPEYRCVNKECAKKFSTTKGTIFHFSKFPCALCCNQCN